MMNIWSDMIAYFLSFDTRDGGEFAVGHLVHDLVV